MPMHPLFAPLLPLLAAFPVLATQDGGQQTGQTDVVALRKDDHNRMTVPVRVLDQGPFQFLIDTGAQNTVLSTALAGKLALVPNRRAKLVGVAGSEMVDTVEIDQIDLGRRSYYGLTAPLLQGEHIGADGIVGLDSLQDQRVLMDFRKGLMAINDAKTLGGNAGYEIVVTARRMSGQLIMTDAVIDGVHTSVVIDTGAENSIGNLSLQRALARNIDRRVLGIGTAWLVCVGQLHFRRIGFGFLFQREQRLVDFFHRRTVARLFGQQCADQAPDFWIQSNHKLGQRLRGIHQMHRNQVAHRRPQKRRLTGQHLVQNHPKRIDIRSVGRELGPPTLLWRHVGRRTHQHIAFGADRLSAQVFRHFRNAEIEQLDPFPPRKIRVPHQHDVVWLRVYKRQR